ncbi:MAG: hypothetical protein ACK56F_07885, partial [bacterium]
FSLDLLFLIGCFIRLAEVLLVQVIMNVGGWRILQAIRRVRMADVYIARNIISRILYLGDPLSKCNIACCNTL